MKNTQLSEHPGDVSSPCGHRFSRSSVAPSGQRSPFGMLTMADRQARETPCYARHHGGCDCLFRGGHAKWAKLSSRNFGMSREPGSPPASFTAL